MAYSLLMISLLVGVCFSDFFVVHAMRCMHDPDRVKLITGVPLDYDDVQPRRKRQLNTIAPIRVSFIYHSSGVTTPQQEARLQRIIQDVQGTLRSLLNVKSPLTRPLLFQRACSMDVFESHGCRYDCETTTCGPIPFPEDHLRGCVICNSSTNCFIRYNKGDGPGLSNTDIVIYYTILSSGDCTRVIAYANACQLEGRLDRPITGYIVFCLNALNRLSDTNLFTVAIHEATHVLGFSRVLYKYYRDENGNPRTRRQSRVPVGSTNTTFRTVQYSDWLTRHGRVSHSVTMMVTPNVRRQASLQYGCAVDSIMGVELENNGVIGTAGSHWEARILGNEYMTGRTSFNSPVSRITLGLLHDTGWYVPNYEHAEALAWGRGAGCRFLHGSCLEHINSQISRRVTLNPFCNVLNDVGGGGYKYCTVDRDKSAFCNLALLTSTLPTNLQYFTSGANFNASTVDLSRVGGSQEVFDRCPFHEPDSHARSCSDSGNQPSDNVLGETFGAGSRCFGIGLRWNRTDSNGRRVSTVGRNVGCYQYACSSDGVEIKFFNQRYLCACEGEKMVIDAVWDNFRYQGSFICPSCNDICFDSLSNCTNSTNRAPCPEKVTLKYITESSTPLPQPPSTVLPRFPSSSAPQVSTSTSRTVPPQSTDYPSRTVTASRQISSPTTVKVSNQTSSSTVSTVPITSHQNSITGTDRVSTGNNVGITSGTPTHCKLGLFMCSNIVLLAIMG